MRLHKALRPILLLLVGALAGSMLATPIVHAATKTPDKKVHPPESQSVLVSTACNESCSDTLHACGTIGGVFVQGYGDVVLTDANGTVIWKADPEAQHITDTFVPGILFTTDVTVTASEGSGIRYIVYGTQFDCSEVSN